MKKAFCWIGGIFILLIAGAAVAVHMIDTEFISEKVSKAVEDATGAPLEFSSLPSITLLPPGVAFNELRWDTVKEGQGLRFTAQRGKANIEVAPLLTGKVVIGEISLESPSMEILLPESPTDEEPENSLPQAENESEFVLPTSLPLELKALKVTKGSLLYAQGTQKYQIGDIDISIQHLLNNTDAQLACSLNYTLQGLGEELSGNLDLSAKANLFTARPSISDLSLKVTPDRPKMLTDTGTVQVTGSATFDPEAQVLGLKDVTLTLPTAEASFTGAANLKELSAKGAFQLSAAPRALAARFGIKFPATEQDNFSLKGNIDASQKKLALSEVEGNLDSTFLKADMLIALDEIPSIRSSLSFGDLNVSAYIPQSDTSAEKSQEKAITSDPSEKQNEKAVWPTLDIHMDIASLQWNGITVNNIAMALHGSDGDYSLEKLSASLKSGGTLDASASARMNQNSYAVKFTAQDINIGPIAEAQGKGRSVEGTAYVQADLTAEGKDADALMASFSGSGDLKAQNLRIEALSALLKSHPEFKSIVSSTFTQMHAPFTASKGVVKISPVTATSNTLNATAAATVNLPKQYVQGSSTIKTLGMNIPINIEGPFTNISYSLDPRFAVNLLKGVGGAVVDEGKNVGGFASDTVKGTGSAVKGLGTSLKKKLLK